MAETRIRTRLRSLYEGAGETGDRFRHLLLGYDLLAVTWQIASSFLPRGLLSTEIDITIGLVFLAGLVARLLIARKPLRELFGFWDEPTSW